MISYLLNSDYRASQDTGIQKMNLFATVNVKRFFCVALCPTLILFFLQGCASITDGQQTVGEGAATGVVIGGVIGGVAGLLVGDNGESAAIGAAIGAVAGTLYGNHVASKKQDFANKEAYMKAVIAEADKVLANSRETRKTLKLDIAARKKTIDFIKSQRTSKSELNTSLAQLSKKNSQDIEKINQLILGIEDEMKVQKTVLVREKYSLSQQLVSLSETKTSGLETEHRKLKLLKAQLANLDIRRMY